MGHFKTVSMFLTPACCNSPFIWQLYRKWSMWLCHPKCLLWHKHSHHMLPTLHSTSWGPSTLGTQAPSHESCCVCSSKGFPLFCCLFLWFSSSSSPREWAHQPGSHMSWGPLRETPWSRVPTHSPMCMHCSSNRKCCASGCLTNLQLRFHCSVGSSGARHPACSWGRCSQGWTVLEEL